MTKLIHQEHDRFFKKLMENPKVAREFFEKNLPPKFLGELDLSTLKFQNPAKISQKLKLSEADVLYSAKMKDSRRAYFYLLLEHQSTSAPMMPFRILVYQVDTMKAHHEKYPNEPLPIVYPMVLYSGTSKWFAARDIFELFGDSKEFAKEALLQPFKLIDLHRVDDEILKNQLWAGIFQYAMKHRKAREIADMLKTLLLWVKQLHVKSDDIELARIVLYYLLKDLDDAEEDVFRQSIRKYLPGDLRGEAMTIAEQLENRGIQQGIQQGLQQGLEQGRQQGLQLGQKKLEETVRNMLLEGLPVTTIAKVSGLSVATIEKLQLEIY